MRRKLVLALAVLATLGSATFTYVSAQDDTAIDKPFNCFGGYGGGCGDSWIKNCYC